MSPFLSRLACQILSLTDKYSITPIPACWMEAPWLTTVLNMFADISQHCPIITNLIMDVLVGHVLKSLPYLHFTPWLLRDVCCADRVSPPQSIRLWWGNSNNYIKGLPAVLEGIGRLTCLRGCTKQYHICLKLVDFLVHLFRVGLDWHTIGNLSFCYFYFFRTSSSSQGF